MAEDRVDTRETSWRHLFPWTELFRGFRVAIGLSKLALAAAGILVMSLLWYVLAVIFFNFTSKPDWESGNYTQRHLSEPETNPDRPGEPAERGPRAAHQWRDFLEDRQNWNLMLETAGPAPADEAEVQTFDPGDLADNLPQYKAIRALLDKGVVPPDDGRVRALLEHLRQTHKVTRAEVRQLTDFLTVPAAGKEAEETARAENEIRAKALVVNAKVPKSYGMLRTLPWFEDRGPNPFLLATGQTGVPWEAGHFWDWLLTRQGPVLVEPLVKFLRPVVYFFSSRAGWWARLYFLLVILATLATWALFGAAITRMAAVEVARNEKISPVDALRFVAKRYLNYALAPIFPLAIVAVFVLVLIVYGILHMIPLLGDILIDGLFWWFAIALGLGMACFLIGLVSWPLMVTTISTEDEEGFNAFARAYSYLIQAPWHYLWYSVVALAYGAVVVFFVGLMGSLAVYLASWGVNNGTFARSRNPSFLFVYAPTSFDWRDLLLQGASVQEGTGAVVSEGKINPNAYKQYVGEMAWYNTLAAWMVAFWLGLFFLLILGFGYSYFWTASSIIYLLLRRKVDDAELDEVYFEEDEQDEYPLGPPAAPKPAAAAPTPGMTMVEPPALRVPPPAAPPAASAPPPAATPPPPPLTPAPAPPAVGADRVEEPVRPATAAATPPAPPPEDHRPDGDGNPPPPREG
jgi:hypothetical protein